MIYSNVNDSYLLENDIIENLKPKPKISSKNKTNSFNKAVQNKNSYNAIRNEDPQTARNKRKSAIFLGIVSLVILALSFIGVMVSNSSY